MKPPNPTGFKTDIPPAVSIREELEPVEEPEDDTFEIKNPVLANLFHYGMIGILLTIVFVIAGSFIGLKYLRVGGGDRSISALVLAIVLGGGFAVAKLIQWTKSDDYIDKDQGGF